MKQPHLRVDVGDVNDYCIIVGRPERIQVINKLLTNVKKVSDNRGYIVYNGVYQGVPITICNTGIGGPSAAIAIEELINCGAKTIIRVGSGGVLRKNINTGDLVISTGVCKEEKATTAYFPSEFAAVPDFDTTTALIESARELKKTHYYGITMCTDAFYTSGHRERMLDWAKYGVLGSDMESSMLFAVARVHQVRAGFVFYAGLNIMRKQDFKNILQQEKLRAAGERDAVEVALNAIKKLTRVKTIYVK